MLIFFVTKSDIFNFCQLLLCVFFLWLIIWHTNKYVSTSLLNVITFIVYGYRCINTWKIFLSSKNTCHVKKHTWKICCAIHQNLTVWLEIICEEKSVSFIYMCAIFSGENFNRCYFFYGWFRPCEIFWCVKFSCVEVSWMFFPDPHGVSSSWSHSFIPNFNIGRYPYLQHKLFMPRYLTIVTYSIS